MYKFGNSLACTCGWNSTLIKFINFNVGYVHLHAQTTTIVVCKLGYDTK